MLRLAVGARHCTPVVGVDRANIMMTTTMDMMTDKNLFARLAAVARHGTPGVGVGRANGMKRMMGALMTANGFFLRLAVGALHGTPIVGVDRSDIVMRMAIDVMIDEQILNASNGLLTTQAPTRDGRDGRITGLTHDLVRPLVSSIVSVTIARLVGSAVDLCVVLGDVPLGSLGLRAG